MSDREVEQNAMLESNVLKALRDGPRLRKDYSTWVVARDRKRKRVMLGGLGGMGVGQMWFDEASLTAPEKNHGYDDAPEMDSDGGFGT